jgi:ADP-ribose pyrophosphatase YjhB (NUDIX family)
VAEAHVRVRVAACITEGDRILLVQHAKAGRRYWLLPGGGVEVGESLAAAIVREVEEETGLRVEPGRLLLVCESIEPGGRHRVNLVFSAVPGSGELRTGDGVVDAAWTERGLLQRRDLRPPIAAALEACWAEDFAGPVRVLGDVWRPEPPQR